MVSQLNTVRAFSAPHHRPGGVITVILYSLEDRKARMNELADHFAMQIEELEWAIDFQGA